MLIQNGWDYRECRCENNGDYCSYCEDFHYGNGFENQTLEPEDVMTYRTIVSHAYEHENRYIEINRWTMSREEIMAALSSLLTLGKAIEEAGHEWRDRRNTHATK
jgi:hypothetical protein